MTVDREAHRDAVEEVWGSVGWGPIAGLAAVVVVVLTLYGVGVLLPYFVNDLHRLPSAQLAGGAHDPMDLWPQDGWAGPVAVAGLLGVSLGPLVLLGVVGLGVVWLWSLWRRRREPGIALRSLAVLATMAASVAALLFWLSEPGSALAAWRLD